MSIGMQRASVMLLLLQACSAESPTQAGAVSAFNGAARPPESPLASDPGPALNAAGSRPNEGGRNVESGGGPSNAEGIVPVNVALNGGAGSGATPAPDPPASTPPATGGDEGAGGSTPDPGETVPTGSEPVAFPGAEGFGRFARGGRRGDVYHVTSIADAGAGSLREGVTTATGPRTIVFDVSGTIELASDLQINGKSFLTIAGQTAPGDGITLRNHALFIDRSEHVVVRYVRSRLGDTAGIEADAASVTNSSNIIFDHTSLSWSVDSVFDLTKFTGLATVQWSILSEGLYNSVHSKGPHSYAAGWDGKGAGGSSYHHNLLASCNSRMPRVDGIDPVGLPGPLVDVRNNVIYNWGSGFAYGGEFANTNFVGNYLRPGPSSTRLGWLFEVSGRAGRIFVDGNFVEGQPGITSDNPTGVNLGVVAAEFAVAPVSTEAAADAYARVLDGAGASKVRDAVDLRVVADVRNRTGRIIDSQAEVGGWPLLASAPAPTDTDQDGMPDAWEVAEGLDPRAPEDRNGDGDQDGYTNLEEYLNGLVSIQDGASFFEPSPAESLQLVNTHFAFGPDLSAYAVPACRLACVAPAFAEARDIVDALSVRSLEYLRMHARFLQWPAF